VLDGAMSGNAMSCPSFLKLGCHGRWRLQLCRVSAATCPRIRTCRGPGKVRCGWPAAKCPIRPAGGPAKMLLVRNIAIVPVGSGLGGVIENMFECETPHPRSAIPRTLGTTYYCPNGTGAWEGSCLAPLSQSRHCVPQSGLLMSSQLTITVAEAFACPAVIFARTQAVYRIRST
jgi:hypothetical protein